MRGTKRSTVGLAVVVAASFAGCNRIATQALDQAAPRRVDEEIVAAIEVPQGFRARQVVEGLNFPSSIAWDAAGRLYVLESHTVPVPLLAPRILRVEGRELEEVKLEGPDAPSGAQAIGLKFHVGWL